MANAEKLKPFILKWEGGYVNDPDDYGGATNKGVTIATFRRFIGKDATLTQLKNITDEQWMTVFKDGYWNPWKADWIKDQGIANIVVDWGWASGPVTAIRQVQRLLGVAVDGLVGVETLDKINSLNPTKLFDEIKQDRLDFVDNIVMNRPSQIKFIKGWKNRINSIPRK